jgi:hypothetical protein
MYYSELEGAGHGSSSYNKKHEYNSQQNIWYYENSSSEPHYIIEKSGSRSVIKEVRNGGVHESTASLQGLNKTFIGDMTGYVNSEFSRGMDSITQVNLGSIGNFFNYFSSLQTPSMKRLRSNSFTEEVEGFGENQVTKKICTDCTIGMPTFDMVIGGTTYLFEIGNRSPSSGSDSVVTNEELFSMAKLGKEATGWSAVPYAFSIYNVTPNKRMKLSDFIGTEGDPLQQIKSKNSGLFIFNRHIHPFYGESKDTKTDTAKVNQAFKGSYISINTDYQYFVKNTEYRGLTKTTKEILKDSGGYQDVLFNGEKKDPNFMVNVRYPVSVPAKIVDSNGVFSFSEDVKISDNLKIDIGTSKMYKTNPNGRDEELGDYSKYGLSRDYIYIQPQKSKSNKAVSDWGTPSLVIASFKEAVRSKSGILLPTGRTIRFNKFENIDPDTLSSGVEYYKTSYDMKLRYLLKTLASGEQGLDIEYDDRVGYCVVLNTEYATDTQLLKWLETSEAKDFLAEHQISMREIIATLRGLFPEDWDKNTLSWEEMQRLSEMKQEMESKSAFKFAEGYRGFITFVGILIIVYSVFLLLAFFGDMVNNIIEFKFLPALTFGRLNVAPDANSTTPFVGSGKRFIRLKTMIFIFIGGVLLGVFIVSGAIYLLVEWFYYTLKLG